MRGAERGGRAVYWWMDRRPSFINGCALCVCTVRAHCATVRVHCATMRVHCAHCALQSFTVGHAVGECPSPTNTLPPNSATLRSASGGRYLSGSPAEIPQPVIRVAVDGRIILVDNKSLVLTMQRLWREKGGTADVRVFHAPLGEEPDLHPLVLGVLILYLVKGGFVACERGQRLDVDGSFCSPLGGRDKLCSSFCDGTSSAADDAWDLSDVCGFEVLEVVSRDGPPGVGL